MKRRGDAAPVSMPLPDAYIARVREQLGAEDAEAYFAALAETPVRGLRLRPNLDAETPPRDWIDGLGDAVPWAQGGYYLAADSRAGASIAHEAGAFYVQEPSAMAAVSALAPRAGERVLDLCAAPGGKSTQIAAAMNGEGLLVANEPDARRARVLAENLTRMGVTNAVVVSAMPDTLARAWAGFFDQILVDAPCSGEGMFRKHPEARAEWTPAAPEGCQKRQLAILDAAVALLAPEGRLCYATCTLNRAEDEAVSDTLLARYPCLSAEPFALDGLDGLDGLNTRAGRVKLWPHRVRGEGHFVALFRRDGGADGAGTRSGDPFNARDMNGVQSAGAQSNEPRNARGMNGVQSAGARSGDPRNARGTNATQSACALIPPSAAQLAAANAYFAALGIPAPLTVNAAFGDILLHVPDAPPLSGIRVLKAGVEMLELRKGRAVPTHALSHALRASHGFPAAALSDAEADAYLRGEELPTALSDGDRVVTWRGLALGFARASGGRLKNLYPKALRASWIRRNSARAAQEETE